MTLKKHLPSAIIFLFIIASITSILLILIEDTRMKYAFTVFSFLLALILSLTVLKFDFRIQIKRIISKRTVDYILISCCIILLVRGLAEPPLSSLTFTQLESSSGIFEYLSLTASILVVFLVPGWVLLRIIQPKIMIENALLPTFCIIFGLSIGLSSLIYMSAIYLELDTSSVTYASFFTGISIIPIVADTFRNRTLFTPRHSSLVKTSLEGREKPIFTFSALRLAFIIWVLSFLLYVLLELYPQISFIPGLDIVRHDYQTNKMILSPNSYFSEYPWFHIILVLIKLLASPPFWLFQIMLAFLSTVLIMVFYVVSKKYLSELDRRAPVVATAIFAVSGGFGWLYLVPQIGLDASQDQLALLYDSNSASYYDTGLGHGSWLWMWFRPITLGFIVFLLLVFVMGIERSRLSRIKYVTICVLLVTTLAQIHFPELFVFVVLVLILTIFTPSLGIRLRETAISLAIGLLITSLISLSYTNVFSSTAPTSTSYIIALLAISMISIMLSIFKKRPSMTLKIQKKWQRLLILGSIFIYCIFVFHWYYTASEFSIVEVVSVLGVPVIFYPVLLGLLGLITIPALFLVFSKYRKNPIVIFAIFFFVAIIIGKVITIVNLNLMYTGYWERRMIPFVYLSASIISPLIILTIFDRLSLVRIKMPMLRKGRNTVNINRVVVACFSSLLVITTIMSTLFAAEFQKLKTEPLILTSDEKEIQQSFGFVPNDATFLSISDRSRNLAYFSTFSSIVNKYRDQVWPSIYPELPLNVLNSVNQSLVIYLQDKDIAELIRENSDEGYLFSHLLDVAKTVRQSHDGSRILVVPNMPGPVTSSDTILVTPDINLDASSSNSYYTAYDLLSMGSYNYSTAVKSDLGTIGQAKTIIVPTEDMASEVMDYIRQINEVERPRTLVILNLDGYGKYGELDENGLTKLSLTNQSDTAWKVIGHGSGSIGLPNLYTSHTTTVPDKSSSLSSTSSSITPYPVPEINYEDNASNTIHIRIDSGNYSRWSVTASFLPTPVSLSKHDFLTFSWFGRGDSKSYIFDIFGESSELLYRFGFEDSWHGWKQLILPLLSSNMKQGYDTNGGIEIIKTANFSSYSSFNLSGLALFPDADNLNAGGEFYIRDVSLGRTLNSSFPITDVSDYPELDTASIADMRVYDINLKNQYTTELSYPNSTIPLVSSGKIGNITAFYLNIFPAVGMFDKSINYPYNAGDLIDLLHRYLPEDMSLYEYEDFQIRSSVAGGVSAFTSARFANLTNITTSSAIFYNELDLPLRVTIDDRNGHTFTNISKIVPISNDNIKIHSRGGELISGQGFYTLTRLYEPSIILTGEPALAQIQISDLNSTRLPNWNVSKDYGHHFNFSGNQIKIDSQDLLVLSRNPHIFSSGVTEFGDFYGYGELLSDIVLFGKNMTSSGEIEFEIPFGDRYMLTKNFKSRGELNPSLPLYSYNELSLIDNIFSFPYLRFLLTLVAIYLVVDYYIFERQKRKIASR